MLLKALSINKFSCFGGKQNWTDYISRKTFVNIKFYKVLKTDSLMEILLQFSIKQVYLSEF